MGKGCEKRMKELQATFKTYLDILETLSEQQRVFQEGMVELVTMAPGAEKDRRTNSYVDMATGFILKTQKEIDDQKFTLLTHYKNLKEYFDKKSAKEKADVKYNPLKTLIKDVGANLKTLGLVT